MVAIATTMIAASVSAQGVDATGTASSAASNNLTFNGGAVAAPSLSGNNTASCVVANGAGFGVPGLSLGASGGHIDQNCATLVEVEFLVKLLSMPPSAAKTAAIHHACKNNERLRDTLVSVGACVVKG